MVLLPALRERPVALLYAVRLLLGFQAAFVIEGQHEAAMLVRSLAAAQEAEVAGDDWGAARVAELITCFPALRADSKPRLPPWPTGSHGGGTRPASGR